MLARVENPWEHVMKYRSFVFDPVAGLSEIRSPEFEMYLSKSTKALDSKCTSSTKSKSAYYAECPFQVFNV